MHSKRTSFFPRKKSSGWQQSEVRQSPNGLAHMSPAGHAQSALPVHMGTPGACLRQILVAEFLREVMQDQPGRLQQSVAAQEVPGAEHLSKSGVAVRLLIGWASAAETTRRARRSGSSILRRCARRARACGRE